MKPSNEQVLRALRHVGDRGLTSLEAWDAVGCSRLAARVNELRADGFDIRDRWESVNGARIKRYRLVEAHGGTGRMSTLLCLHLHKSHLRIRHLTRHTRFLWCEVCEAIR
jgi:hypothetical protein